MAGFDKSFSKLQITTADADVPPAKFIRCLANIDDKAKHRCSRKGAPDQKRAYTAKELEERVMDCLCQTHKYHLERQPILDNVLKAPAIGWSYSRALPAVCRPLRRYQAVNPIQPSKTGSTESGKVCNLKYSQHQSGACEPDTKLQYQTNSPFLHRCTRSSSKYLRYAYTRYDASCLAPETSRTTVILGDKFPDRHGNSATKSCPKREKSDVFALPPRATKIQQRQPPTTMEKQAPSAMPTTDLQGSVSLTFRIYSNVAKAFWLAKGREEVLMGNQIGSEGKAKEGSISCEEEELRSIGRHLEFLIEAQDKLVAESRLQV
ncbi:MAG: hypothetical protein Q9223_002304 [Gallowayella weberi]